MCGICGVYNINGKPLDNTIVKKMADLIKHRGPDDSGFVSINTNSGRIVPLSDCDSIESIKRKYSDVCAVNHENLTLGFRRLSIIDLSENGHQPMISSDLNYVLVFNGEIYNYIELRNELINLGHLFFSLTDTEVIIEAYKEWGIDCLNRFNGMWAFALWDKRESKLFCARDRFGVKPFYFSYNQKQFAFASEIKQLYIHGFQKTLNTDMIYRHLRIGSFLVYHDETFHKEIKSLLPGHYIIIQNDKVDVKPYYQLNPQNFENSVLSFNEACERYREIFLDAVKIRMRSDVQTGSCLSGGLDSSAIVCAAAKLSEGRFNTFSVYYDLDKSLDERKWINLVNDHTGARGHLISPTAEESLSVFEKTTWHNDLPIGSGFVSQYAVMKLARENNTIVLLDGQGSDELTGGYNHAFYRYYADMFRSFSFTKLLKQYPSYLRHNQQGSISAKLIKTFMSVLFKESDLYWLETKYHYFNPLNYQPKNKGIIEHIRDLPVSRLSNFLYNLMYSTSIQTLLHYEDRLSMASSVETRVPFLDYRLVELAFSLPSDYKINDYRGKLIHREAVKPIVPHEIYNRKDKVMFSSPHKKYWLRNELKNYFIQIVSEDRFKKREFYNYPLIKSKFDEFLKGNTKLDHIISNLISLEVWFRVFCD